MRHFTHIAIEDIRTYWCLNEPTQNAAVIHAVIVVIAPIHFSSFTSLMARGLMIMNLFTNVMHRVFLRIK